MARIFRDCSQMVQEMDRELASSGITVPVKHYQNKELTGEDQETKELIGVNFVITQPTSGIEDMLRFIFKDEAPNILEYCKQELQDRITDNRLNPGRSYLVRLDLWQKLMSKDQEGKFDYTYSERLHPLDPNYKGEGKYFYSQLDNAVKALADDEHSRRAMVMVFTPDDTLHSAGAATRIPCSVSYQFLIRNGMLHCIYYIRSNDYFKHFAIDIALTAMMMGWVTLQLKREAYPDLKIGHLHYFAGSLHAYHEDLKNWVIF